MLPTAGRARHGDPTRTEAGGWALRVTQIAVICTYFLAAWAKLRFGGLDWLTGSVLARAIIRRGTDLADLIAQVPHLLIVAQFGIVAFELLSPVVFLLPAALAARHGRLLLLVPRWSPSRPSRSRSRRTWWR